MEPQTGDTYTGPERVPVVVLLRRSPVQGNRWISARWAFDGCAPDPQGSSDTLASDTVHEDDDARLVRWRGCVLELHRDAAEDYWFNLSGDTPRVYLVSRNDDNDEPTPVLITLDHGEAGAYGEADDDVHSAPLPAELYGRVEQFVIKHFKPRVHHKRKRKNWSEKDG